MKSFLLPLTISKRLVSCMLHTQRVRACVCVSEKNMGVPITGISSGFKITA